MAGFTTKEEIIAQQKIINDDLAAHATKVNNEKHAFSKLHLNSLLAKNEKTHQSRAFEGGQYLAISADVEKLLKSVKTEAAKKLSKAEVLELEQVLIKTELFLNRQISPESYKKFANDITLGKLSPALVIIGAIMLALCLAAVLAIGFVTAPVCAIALGAAAKITGVASGVGFFKGRKQGVSKAASDLHSDCLAEIEVMRAAMLPQQIAEVKEQNTLVMNQLLDATEDTRARLNAF